MGLRFQDSAHLVTQPVEHVADGALVGQYFGRVVFALDQLFTHRFCGESRVLEEPLELGVRLRIRLDQFENIASQLGIRVFGPWFEGTGRIGNDLAGMTWPEFRSLMPLATVCRDQPNTVSVSRASPPR